MEHSVKVYEAMIEAGQEFGIGDFGIYAMHVMRLEHGFRMWGAEVSIRYKYRSVVQDCRLSYSCDECYTIRTRLQDGGAEVGGKCFLYVSINGFLQVAHCRNDPIFVTFPSQKEVVRFCFDRIPSVTELAVRSSLHQYFDDASNTGEIENSGNK